MKQAELKIEDVTYREDLYPRSASNEAELDHHKEASAIAVAENKRLSVEVERLRYVLESISSLVVEGPEFMQAGEIYNAILKEIEDAQSR